MARQQRDTQLSCKLLTGTDVCQGSALLRAHSGFQNKEQCTTRNNGWHQGSEHCLSQVPSEGTHVIPSFVPLAKESHVTTRNPKEG